MATYQIETEGGHVYQVDTADEQGPLEAGLRAAGNNFPLAPQAIAALAPGQYSQNMADWKQKAAEAKDQHPVAYGTGAVAGTLAPLAIPGVGAALKAAPLATNAALGAAEAINDTDLSKDKNEALKQAAIGGTVGTLVGKAGDLAGSAADTIGQYAGRFGENQAIKAIGRLPPGVPVDEARAIARRATQDYGLLDADMGPIGRKETVDSMRQQAGHEIGDIRAQASEAGPNMSGEEMANAIREKLKDAYAEGGQNYDQINALEKELQNIKSMPSTTPQDFAQRATDINTKAIGKSAVQPTNVDTDVANAMSQVNDETIARRMPDTAEHYGQLKQTFGDSKVLGNMIERGERRGVMSRGNNTLYEAGSKFVDELGAHKAGARLGMAAGDALQGSAGQGVIKAGTLNTTAGITSAIMGTLQSNPQSLGQFAKPLAKAAQSGGDQGIAATHFILSQNYPQYNKMWQQWQSSGTTPATKE